MLNKAPVWRSSGRSLDQILGIHQLPAECFEGATVYDLGCGFSDIGAGLALRGINAVVKGFDSNPSVIGAHERGADGTTKVLTPLDCLPVPDESADIVLATYSLPLWATSAEEIVGFFSEAVRVVKPKGLLSISPTVVQTGRSNPELLPTVGERMLAAMTEVAKIRSGNWVPLTLDPHDPETLTVRKI